MSCQPLFSPCDDQYLERKLKVREKKHTRSKRSLCSQLLFTENFLVMESFVWRNVVLKCFVVFGDGSWNEMMLTLARWWNLRCGWMTRTEHRWSGMSLDDWFRDIGREMVSVALHGWHEKTISTRPGIDRTMVKQIWVCFLCSWNKIEGWLFKKSPPRTLGSREWMWRAIHPSGGSVLTIIITDEVIFSNGDDDDVEVRGTLSVGTSSFWRNNLTMLLNSWFNSPMPRALETTENRHRSIAHRIFCQISEPKAKPKCFVIADGIWLANVRPTSNGRDPSGNPNRVEEFFARRKKIGVCSESSLKREDHSHVIDRERDRQWIWSHTEPKDNMDSLRRLLNGLGSIVDRTGQLIVLQHAKDIHPCHWNPLSDTPSR